MSNFDSKAYTKMRDIVVKRNKRAVEQGLMPLVHFPTVKEIKSGAVAPSEALSFVKGYISGGSTVKAIKATGLIPEFKTFPVIEFEKVDLKEKRKEQSRLYRRRKKVREIADSPEQAKRYVAYLKALQTVSKAFLKAGVDIGIDLSRLSPAEAQAFVEYMDYRFSQGDFTQHYVIDEFVQDFATMVSKGFNTKDIVGDFNSFLENRAKLEDHSNNMEGIGTASVQLLWDEFIRGKDL